MSVARYDTPTKLPETRLSTTLAAALGEPKFLDAILLTLAARSGDQAWNVPLRPIFIRDNWFERVLDQRETDVFVRLASADGAPSHLLLIEVKICAPFGIEQARDYSRRKVVALSSGYCQHCLTIAVAPRAYLNSHSTDVGQFDLAFALEDLSDLLEGLESPPSEIQSLIGQALRNARLGYIPLQSITRQQQFAFYRQFCGEYMPNLQPHETAGTSQAYDIYHDSPADGWPIKHRLFRGEVVIELLGWGIVRPQVAAKLAPILASDMRISSPKFQREGSKSIHICATHPISALSASRSFADQQSALCSAFDAINRLWQWCSQHRAVLEELTELKRQAKRRG